MLPALQLWRDVDAQWRQEGSQRKLVPAGDPGLSSEMAALQGNPFLCTFRGVEQARKACNRRAGIAAAHAGLPAIGRPGQESAQPSKIPLLRSAGVVSGRHITPPLQPSRPALQPPIGVRAGHRPGRHFSRPRQYSRQYPGRHAHAEQYFAKRYSPGRPLPKYVLNRLQLHTPLYLRDSRVSGLPDHSSKRAHA